MGLISEHRAAGQPPTRGVARHPAAAETGGTRFWCPAMPAPSEPKGVVVIARVFAADKPAGDQHFAAHKEPRAAGPSPLRGSGRPLDAEIRQAHETRFAYDFSEVRVHTEGEDAQSAVALAASAYTAGRDIVFAPGRYQPSSWAGQHLLAHELAHVVQQDARSLRRYPVCR